MSVADQLAELLKKYSEAHPKIRFIAVVDESGLVIGVHPFREDKIDLIDQLVAVFSDIIHNVIVTLTDTAPNIANQVVSISVGLERIKISFYIFDEFRFLIAENY